MNDIHMGQLLEKVIRKKGINISELAAALNITRRTLYNWFKQEVIDEITMQRISSAISYDIYSLDKTIPRITKSHIKEHPLQEERNEEYWKNKYLDLLERYAKLLETNT
ncbi:MAG: helix-turn-helix domain-containing protein [Pedobacter sp.]